jgi:DDE superfamily endonuclease
VNVQVIADAAGRLVWASGALPGSTHDLTAARTHGIIDALTSADVMTFADMGYQGAGGGVRTPFKRHRYRPKLSRRQRAVNRSHARIRARGERGISTLKTWKILAKLRCCPRRTTAIVHAILVLHHVETSRYTGRKWLIAYRQGSRPADGLFCRWGPARRLLARITLRMDPSVACRGAWERPERVSARHPARQPPRRTEQTSPHGVLVDGGRDGRSEVCGSKTTTP